MALVAAAANRARCHPTRREYMAGRCRECHSLAQLALRPPGPILVHGVRQFGAVWLPETCPHCHAGAPYWNPDPEAIYVLCARCGADWHRLSDRAVDRSEIPSMIRHLKGR
jgi:hypothetical protein